eukprot:15807_1
MSFSPEGKEEIEELIPSDNEFKKRIIFIRHGNSIWNKMKAGGTKSKISAIGQGVLEFAKTSYYDTASHKTSTVMDAPVSDIGIKQCKTLYNFLPKRYTKFESDLLSANNYKQSHNKCNEYIHKSSDMLDNILLPINQNHNNKNNELHNDLYKIQNLLNKAKLEINNSIDEFSKRNMKEIKQLETLLSIVTVLIKSSSDSIVVCSNLRRAISTGIISLWHRFESNKKENLYMIKCLQELGYGVDSISHNDTDKVAKESTINNFVKYMNFGQQSAPQDDIKISLSKFEEDSEELNMLNNLNSTINSQKMRLFYEKRLKTIEIKSKLGKMSTKDVKQKNKQENRKESDRKIELFMDWVFNDKKNEKINTFVVIGHSGWIRAFFNKYLDGVYHDYKTNKIKNCGVVAVDIYRNYHFKNNKVNQYTIMLESITTIYEGSL